MSAEEFVSELHRRRSVWRRLYGGNGSHVARRRVSRLVRDRIRWYKSVTGIQALPTTVDAASDDMDWAVASVGEVKIVFPPDEGTRDERPGREEPARKRIRRSLHRLESDGQVDSIELLGSGRVPRRGLPALGYGNTGRRRVSRALYLETIGAAIVPNLSEAQVTLLEEGGAVVIENDAIAVLDPVAGIAAADPTKQPWHLQRVNSAAARAKRLTGKGVKVGVLDTGIDASHPEFAGKTIAFEAFETNGARKPTPEPRDFGSHGTHVSALIAGAKVGVAPGADLAVAAVLTTTNALGRLVGYTAQILAGMNWLARGGGELDRGVDLINASLGGPNYDPSYYLTVHGHRLRGVLVVAAIGNNGRKGIGHHGAPGMFECTLSVGAVDEAGAVADFSAWGSAYAHPVASSSFKPDLVAPGVNVISALPGGRYGARNGTSMACPIVSGTGALLLEQDASLRGNPADLSQRILSLTTLLMNQPVGHDRRRYGRGCLDLSSV